MAVLWMLCTYDGSISIMNAPKFRVVSDLGARFHVFQMTYINLNVCLAFVPFPEHTVLRLSHLVVALRCHFALHV